MRPELLNGLVIICEKIHDRYILLDAGSAYTRIYAAHSALYYVVRIIPVGCLKFTKTKPGEKCIYAVVKSATFTGVRAT